MGTFPHSPTSTDVADSTAVHVPDLDALLPGDVIYNGIHLWLYQSDHAQRMAWIETVNEIEKLGVKTIIAGQTDPAAPDNEAARLIEATRCTSTISTRRSRRVAAARSSSRT